jgi:hypothetical protein
MSARDIESAKEQNPGLRVKLASATRKLIGVKGNARFGSIVQAALRVLDRLDGFVNDCGIFFHDVICRVTAENHRKPSVLLEERHIASAKHSKTLRRW